MPAGLRPGHSLNLTRAALGMPLDSVNPDRALEVEDSEENAALVRIRQFRDRRLAHSLFDQEPDAWPRYADLERLLGVAKEAARLISFAVEGLNVDFDDMAQEDRKNAEGYYASLLDGLKRAARRP
jgi:hypothetical protein